MTRNLDRVIIAAVHLHEHACTIGCRLADGGDCNAYGLSDADHSAAARLLHELDRATVERTVALLVDRERWEAWYRDNVERLDEIDVDMSFAEAAAHYLRDQLLSEEEC